MGYFIMWVVVVFFVVMFFAGAKKVNAKYDDINKDGAS